MPPFEKITDFIKQQFPGQDFIPLHAPYFGGNEKAYVLETIESTFVSSVGAFVNRFEEMMAGIAGTKYAVATVNGTSALHMAMLVGDVKAEDEVLSQSLSFIATLIAISYIGAQPVFIDIDPDTLGMSPKALQQFLEAHGEKRADGFTYNKTTGRRIAACVPMHTFGLPLRIDEIAALCREWNVFLIEDAAESLGSTYKGQATGSFGQMGTFSFNGNKTVTCGGGGALVTNNEALALRAKHLTTQAKMPHRWAFVHDEIGYNYRMPNLNAALACAQLEQLDGFLQNKRQLAGNYKSFFETLPETDFIPEIKDAKANYWLNAISFPDRAQRDLFLEWANDNGVMSRPSWELMHRLPMFAGAQHDGLAHTLEVADRLVNIPSSFRP